MMRNIEIPKDWKVKKLGEISELTAGGTPSTSKPEYWGGNVMWMSSGELNLKKIYDVEGRITELGLKSSSAKIIPEKSILIGLAGQGKTRGTIAMNMVQLCTNQSVAAIMPKNGIIPEYIYHNLDARYQEIRNLSTGDGGRGGLNLQILRGIKLPIPPKDEQVIISNIIGTWDEAITLTKTTIEELKLRNKGLAQQLLTGKKRLNGFSEEWKEVKLGDLFIEITQSNDGAENHKVMTISSTLGLVTQEAKFDRIIAGESLKKYTLMKKKDFAYNKGNSKTYPMGCIYQLEDESALVPFVYICFRPSENIDSKFYSFWFLNHGLDRQLKKIITSGARGDGLLNVSKRDFFKLVIPYPRKDEQKAIAKILEKAEQELKIQQQKLKTLQEQKKGLMQKLLTGEVRVKID